MNYDESSRRAGSRYTVYASLRGLSGKNAHQVAEIGFPVDEAIAADDASRWTKDFVAKMKDALVVTVPEDAYSGEVARAWAAIFEVPCGHCPFRTARQPLASSSG